MAAVIIVSVLFVGAVTFAVLWLTGTHRVAAARVTKSVRSGGSKTVHRTVALMPGKDVAVRYGYAIMGPVALCSLSLSYLELLPLHIALIVFVIPAYSAMLLMGLISPQWGRRAAVGFVAGFLATIMYDAARLFLAYGNDGTDPIGHIGEHLFGDGTAAYVGYIWRFLGNGAGLGILYAMLPEKWFGGVKGGLYYGTLVGLSMLAFLASSEAAQSHLFILDKGTVVNGFIGHWVYGATLGALVTLAVKRTNQVSLTKG